LEEHERALVRAWARCRTYANQDRNNIPDYDTKRFYLTEYENNILGIAGELGVVKALGLSPFDESIWLPFVTEDRYDELKQPDVAGKYEVRSIRKPDNPLAVRTKDVRAGATLVLTYIPHSKYTGWKSEVHIKGLLEAELAWELGTVPEWSVAGDSRIVPQELLKSWGEQ
jgi:hypothetical protein